MPLKKSELYSSIWKSCDQLRGGMDASQYKDYVLVLLFVKYVSDKYAGQKNAVFVVPNGVSFADIVALKGQKEIGDGINKIIAKLAKANNLKGILDLADFNDASKLGRGREMHDRLSNLITIFENPALDFTQNDPEDDIIIGDIYEYLIGMFATNSGRMGGGEYSTPSEISELIAKLVELKPSERIYDPACGSGLLLIKCAEKANDPMCAVYGQEIDFSTRGLAIINLLLHNIKSANIECGDTLRSPLFIDRNQLMKFDAVVSNFPFGLRNWGYEEWQNDKFGRNKPGIPPRNSGDFAWILHAVASMKNDTGRAAIIVPHGVLFRSAEQVLRQFIVENDLLEAVISLGPNLMYSTGVPITILVLRAKKTSNKKKKVLFINASTSFESKDTKNNISAKNTSQILSWYQNFEDVPGSVKVVPINKLGEMGWNLNISHHIKPEPGKLLENAIVSIRLGLDDFEMGTEERIVSSIRNLYAGMLLLFKEKLLRLSPSESNEVLIKSRVIPIKENGKIKFKGSGRETVVVSQIKDRFRDLDIKVEWQRVAVIQNKRNDIEHYYTTEKKDAIREVISSAFIIIHDFIEKELNDNPRELLGEKYWNTMLKTSELFEAKRKVCLNLLKQIKWQPVSISMRVDEICCSSCNSSLITPGETITPKIENQYFTCMSCGQSISYKDLLEALLRDQPFEEIKAEEMSN